MLGRISALPLESQNQQARSSVEIVESQPGRGCLFAWEVKPSSRRQENLRKVIATCSKMQDFFTFELGRGENSPVLHLGFDFPEVWRFVPGQKIRCCDSIREEVGVLVH